MAAHEILIALNTAHKHKSISHSQMSPKSQFTFSTNSLKMPLLKVANCSIVPIMTQTACFHLWNAFSFQLHSAAVADAIFSLILIFRRNNCSMANNELAEICCPVYSEWLCLSAPRTHCQFDCGLYQTECVQQNDKFPLIKLYRLIFDDEIIIHCTNVDKFCVGLRPFASMDEFQMEINRYFPRKHTFV